MSFKCGNKKEGKNSLPPSPPPAFQPPYCKLAPRITPEMLTAYLNTYIYVWIVQGCSFWMFPEIYKNDMLCGYIWSGESWEPACISYKLIDSIY